MFPVLGAIPNMAIYSPSNYCELRNTLNRVHTKKKVLLVYAIQRAGKIVGQ